jgi:hypothetical protein
MTSISPSNEDLKHPPALDYPKDHCQSCGFDLGDFQDPKLFWKHGAQACDKCPACGCVPHWTSGSVKNRKIDVVEPCALCKEPFIQRVLEMTDEQWCGERRRVRVTRGFVSKHCGACREEMSARQHEAQAKNARERAKEKRESQRRGFAKFQALQEKRAEKMIVMRSTRS